MIINGYKYNKVEILEALEKRGYSLILTELVFVDESFPNGKEIVKYEDHCAIRGDEVPSDNNRWQTVARKEFPHPLEKPPLV